MDGPIKREVNDRRRVAVTCRGEGRWEDNRELNIALSE